MKSYKHICRVLDDQCYIIRELEEDEQLVDEKEENTEEENLWRPAKKRINDGKNKEEASDTSDTDNENLDSNDESDQEDCIDGKSNNHIGLKDPEDVSSDSLQNPHDDEATYRKKREEEHYGYKANLSETCDDDNSFQVITDVVVDTNNTEDTELLDNSVERLRDETGLENLLNDGGFSGEEIENKCKKMGVKQHISGIKGPDSSSNKYILLGDTEFEGNRMTSCPMGHQPYEQSYNPETKRHHGRMDKSICDNCPKKDECFAEEKQKFYSFGFYDRAIELAIRRKSYHDSEEIKLLKKRAGAESMVNQVFCKSGKRAKVVGKYKVYFTTICKAFSANFKRFYNFVKNQRKRVNMAKISSV